MKLTILILFIIYLIKVYGVNKLRQKRDNIDFTTYSGKNQIRDINNTIDILTGVWLLRFLKKK